MTRDFVKQTWRGGVRRLAVLALLGAGCKAGTCGSASGSGPLSEEERRGMPGVIAFVSERAPQKDVWLVRPTGEQSQLTRGPEDEYPGAPSPDGASLLVVAAAEVQGLHVEQLRLAPLDGGPVVLLAPPRGRARNPSWSPDGSWFVAESDAQSFSDVVRQAPRADAEVMRLTQAPEGNFEPSVSPDGTQVAFVSSRTGDPEIYVMKADGTDVRQLTNFHMEDMAPKWSPDGKWIAFLSDREGRVRVFVVKPDGTGMRAVSGSQVTGEEREPAWSPDGKKLAFVGRAKDQKARIWVADMAGGEPVALTDGKSIDDQPAWSPDGKYVVYVSERTGDVELFLMRANGSGQTQLTNSKGADWLPRWFVPKAPLPAGPGAGRAEGT
ncbi:TolB family protein [Archangium lansingense]|uniref:LpqB family beta-propeller domain-containing protein n=1 Tax=Archangium lansingense TaxID=2995310 RepID=A0ABT3ZWB4_9BACT|nr:LpqB family beta-propeller domain-containing protein [Archangium lansinium]MCY1073386.1 LpqB family beta-propeller domain-containing protein [Archangium lansinium]